MQDRQRVAQLSRVVLRACHGEGQVWQELGQIVLRAHDEPAQGGRDLHHDGVVEAGRVCIADLEGRELTPVLRRAAESLWKPEPYVKKVLRHELEPVEAAQRILDPCGRGLDLGRGFDDPALEQRVLLDRELVVEALERLAPGEEGRPSVVEAREEIPYAREI
jgi:hypothetical protein